MPKRVPISTAKMVAEKHDLSQVLLIGWDGELAHVVTYGKTKTDCEAAAAAQDFWTGHIREFTFQPTLANVLAASEAREAALRERVGELEKGLEPFAFPLPVSFRECDAFRAIEAQPFNSSEPAVALYCNVGDFRHAAQLLKDNPNG